MDDADYKALLRNLAESDTGRREAPPVARAAISDLPKAEIRSKEDAMACARCKGTVIVGEIATELP